jgi:hypothetical protein
MSGNTSLPTFTVADVEDARIRGIAVGIVYGIAFSLITYVIFAWMTK